MNYGNLYLIGAWLCDFILKRNLIFAVFLVTNVFICSQCFCNELLLLEIGGVILIYDAT